MEENITEIIIKTPPMVGVPDFEKCDSGPSSLIDWDAPISLNFLIKYGAIKMPTKKAVKKAASERKVIYLNRLKIIN